MVNVRYRGRRTTLVAPLRRAPSYVGGQMVGAPKPCGVKEAARLLGCSPTSLRRWIKAGAPVVREAGRGCKGAALVDPAAIVAWRNRAGSDIRRFADHLPDLLGRAVYTAFVVTTQTPINRLHGVPYGQSVFAGRADAIPAAVRAKLFCDLWALTCTTLLDHLRELDPDVGRLRGNPVSIQALRDIANR